MAGYVRAVGKCPVCGERFQEGRTGRERVFICPEHQTMPRRVYVDTSGFGLKRRFRYSDKQGNVFKTREHGEQFLDALRVAKADRATWDPSEWDAVDCRESRFAAKWTKYAAARSPKWGKRHARQTKHICTKFLEPAWGEMDVRDFRNGHLIDLETKLRADGRRESYIKLILGVAMAFLNHLFYRGDIKAKLVCPTIEVPERDLWVLTADQQERVIRKTKQRFHLLMRLHARVGVRPCEICSLKVRDVVGGFIFFQRSIDDMGNVREHTKKNQVFRKPIPADLAEDITRQMRNKLPEAFLFTGRTGAPFRPEALSRAWKKAAGPLGIPTSYNVAMRHSFATQTWDAEEAQARKRTAAAVGHSSERTTFKNYVAGNVRQIKEG